MWPFRHLVKRRPFRHLVKRRLSTTCTWWSFLCYSNSEIYTDRTRVHFETKIQLFSNKLDQCLWIQSMIDLIPVSTHIKRASIILVGWSGIESPTTLFYCYHQTTWFVCFVQFIFHQLLILIALESTRLTHLKFARIRI